MSKIVIIGAGAMGSAFALPCIDNKHDVCIIGTHLENDFIDNFIDIKYEEVQQLRQRPHPHEFFMYYDA